MLTMNSNGFNLFSAVQLGPAGAEKKNQLIFKQSSVRYEDALCLHLSGFFPVDYLLIFVPSFPVFRVFRFSGYSSFSG
jgi:hypothetical protein